MVYIDGCQWKFPGYPAALWPGAGIDPCQRSGPSVNLTGTVRAPMLLLLGLLMDRLTLLVACLTLFGAPTIASAEGKQPMTVENLLSFKRVADPQVRPDGKLAAYVVTSVDLAANKTSSAIWVASTEKGEPRQLTNVPGKKDRNPRFSPDGKKILFESNRSGETQLWVIDLSGGEAQQLTTISTGAESATWSPDGKQIAFVSAIYPEFSEKPFK